jgi:fumarate hydratase subunit beta
MTEKVLVTPLSEEEVRMLKIGDVVYLTGIIYTARDEAHARALEYVNEGKDLPFYLRDAVLYHCGPLMRKTDRLWEVVAAGPTTSARMNPFEVEFIEKLGIRAVIGKGGMDSSTVRAMERYGCVYLAMAAAAVLAAECVREVKDVYWLDLGMPEAIWVLEVRQFGPLTVAIDAHGNSLHARIDEEVKRNVIKIRARLELNET